MLSAAERSRARGFIQEEDGGNFIITYGMLRVILRRHCQLLPQEIHIRRNNFGKPYVNIEHLHFNLAHTKNLLAIAVANHPVGIDVEYPDPNLSFGGLLI